MAALQPLNAGDGTGTERAQPELEGSVKCPSPPGDEGGPDDRFVLNDTGQGLGTGGWTGGAGCKGNSKCEG